MFAHVFDTARRILSRSPSVPGRAEESNDLTLGSPETDADAAMVTTRRGAGVDVPVESTPQSSARKGRGKRELRSLEVETPTTKRRRKSAGIKEQPRGEVEVKEDATEALPEAANSAAEMQGEQDIQDSLHDSIAVAIPVRTKGKSSSPAHEDKPPSSRSGSPKVVINKRLSPRASSEASPTKSDFHTPAAHPSSVFTTPATHMVPKDSPTPKAGSQSKKGTPRSTRASVRQGKKLEVKDTPTPKSTLPDEIPLSTWENDEVPTPTQDSVPASTPSTKKVHKRFGSEEPLDVALEVASGNAPEAPKEAEAGTGGDELDEAEDSDEAPEMVTTASAASKARATAEETARAHLAQKEKEEKKKQQRAARIAEEQAEKRKRDEHRAKKLAKRQAREERLNRTDSTALKAPLDVDMDSLPALLPDSILEAVGDRRPASPPPMRIGKTAEQLRKEKLSRHIKFLDRSEKPVKDVKKGSLSVSVLAQQNALLAPKVNRDTKRIRESWLKGREKEKKGKKAMSKQCEKKAERRVVGGGGGFLRGRDD